MKPQAASPPDQAQQDPADRDAIVAKHRNLVQFLVHQHRHSGMEVRDLVQAGYLGLLTAMERYDERRDTKFSSYAFWWIRSAIQKEIAKNARCIRLPEHIWTSSNKIQPVSRRMREELQREPTVDEVATTGLTPQYVTQYLIHSRTILSLDRPETDQNDDDYRDSIKMQQLSYEPISELREDTQAMCQDVRLAVSELDERQQHVIRSIFGIGQERQSWKQPPADLQVGYKRTKTICNQAMKVLEQVMAERQMHLYL